MNAEKTKHTPGPWAVRESSNPKNGTAWRDIVSTGDHFSPSYVGEAMEQDASLIAAAPDLLAAVRGLLDYRCRRSGKYRRAAFRYAADVLHAAEGEG